MGNAHPNIVPYQEFPTSDGHMIITVGNDSQFAKFCAAVGRPGWAVDQRFATNPQRVLNRKTLVALIQAITVTQTTDAWVAAMEAAGVPCGPINSIDKVFTNPQVQSRGMWFEMSHPLAGVVPLIANPIRMSESPVEYRCAPPILGQHTEEVLQSWLGMDPSEIADLRGRHVR
jgi:glutaryl-CoA transferase